MTADPDTRTHDRRGRPLRQVDRDRTDVAAVLTRARVNREDIAACCGIQSTQVPAVLRGERV